MDEYHFGKLMMKATLCLRIFLIVYFVVMMVMSVAKKDMLLQHFVMYPSQWLFHMGHFPPKQDVFEFITKTSDICNDEQQQRPSRK